MHFTCYIKPFTKKTATQYTHLISSFPYLLSLNGVAPRCQPSYCGCHPCEPCVSCWHFLCAPHVNVKAKTTTKRGRLQGGFKLWNASKDLL